MFFQASGTINDGSTDDGSTDEHSQWRHGTTSKHASPAWCSRHFGGLYGKQRESSEIKNTFHRPVELNHWLYYNQRNQVLVPCRHWECSSVLPSSVLPSLMVPEAWKNIMIVCINFKQKKSNYYPSSPVSNPNPLQPGRTLPCNDQSLEYSTPGPFAASVPGEVSVIKRVRGETSSESGSGSSDSDLGSAFF